MRGFEGPPKALDASRRRRRGRRGSVVLHGLIRKGLALLYHGKTGLQGKNGRLKIISGQGSSQEMLNHLPANAAQ